MSEPRALVADLLANSRTGDQRAAVDLQTILYQELHGIAEGYLRHERAGHTLQPTALVHEAYMRLARSPLAASDRTSLLAAAATAMRRVLVDHARRRGAQKRGRADRLSVDATAVLEQHAQADVDILAVDEAMQRLAHLDARQARIVELRFFAGMTTDEIASELGLSRRTVQGDWSMARAWLRGEMRRGTVGDAPSAAPREPTP